MKEFCVLFLCEERAQCCRFRKTAGRFRLKEYDSMPMNPADPAETCRKLLHRTGYGKDIPLIVSCAMKEGIIYRCGCARLPANAMRSALEFELPRRLLHEPENGIIQFLPLNGETEEGVPVNVYAFPGSAMSRLAAIITQSARKADFYLYPLIALREEDGPLYLPELEPDFFFDRGEWHPVAALPSEDTWLPSWESEFRKQFQLPAGGTFRIRDYLPVLLTARLVSSAEFQEHSGGLNILPAELRPSRLRNQISLLILLLFLLLLNFFWEILGDLSQNYREYTRLNAERGRLATQVRTTALKLKAAEKENRELTRIANQSAGEHDIVGKLAEFSSLLPDNVMVMSVRWTEGAVDITMRSEAQDLNLPVLLKPLTYWKVSQLQQRRRGNETASMITMKLIPAEGKR